MSRLRSIAASASAAALLVQLAAFAVPTVASGEPQATPAPAEQPKPAPKPAPAPPPQAAIKVNDEISLRFGALLQTQAEFAETLPSYATSQNLFMRRIRLLMGGNIGKQFSFFIDTDNPNLGKSVNNVKTISSGFIVQDAFLEYKPSDNFHVQGGLIIIPLCRNCLQSATNLFALDYGPFSFMAAGAMQSVTNRDTGFQAKAYALGKRLELRAAVFQGVREPGSRNAFRFAGRAQYSVWDADVTQMFYAGTTFGSRKMLTFGVGVDTQDDYRAIAGDVYLDRRAGPGVATFQVDAIKWDGGTFLRSLPEQMTILAEGGYHVPRWRLTPYVQVATQRFSSAAFEANDQTKTQVGMGYFFRGHYANVKAAYTRTSLRNRDGLNGFNVQLQVFFY